MSTKYYYNAKPYGQQIAIYSGTTVTVNNGEFVKGDSAGEFGRAAALGQLVDNGSTPPTNLAKLVFIEPVTATGTSGYSGFSGAGVSGFSGFSGYSGLASSSLTPNVQGGAYAPQLSDSGKFIDISTGGVTVNAGIFSAGNIITIFNDSGSNQTVSQGASVTLRQAGTASTGNRTLAQYGVATILCVGVNTFIISGPGIS